MQPFEKICEYAQTVCSHIRWKKARPAVAEEIENHLIDQRNAYMAEGTEEAAATDQAIVQMGDPVVVGVQLNRTHRPKPPWVMLGLTAAMLLIGFTILIYFNTDELSARRVLAAFSHQAIALGLLTAMYFLGFSWIGKRPVAVYLLLLAAFAVGYAINRLGVAWSFVHYIPLLFPLGFAGVVYSTRGKGYRGIVLCWIAFLLPAAGMLLIWERTITTKLLLFTASAFVTLCVAVSKDWFRVKKSKGYLLVVIPAAIAFLAATAFIISDSSTLGKIMAAFNLSYAGIDKYTFGAQIKAALAGSKFIGQGVIPDYGIGDPGYSLFYILTSCIFYYGWISVVPVIGLLLYFIIKGFRLCFRQKSGFALLLSLSVILIFTIEIISYVLFNLGFDLFSPLLPPFLIWFIPAEYYINAVLAGIMLSVFRTGHVLRDNPAFNQRMIKWSGGKSAIPLGKK